MCLLHQVQKRKPVFCLLSRSLSHNEHMLSANWWRTWLIAEALLGKDKSGTAHSWLHISSTLASATQCSVCHGKGVCSQHKELSQTALIWLFMVQEQSCTSAVIWNLKPVAACTNPKSAKRAWPSLHKSTLACTGSLVNLN